MYLFALHTLPTATGVLSRDKQLKPEMTSRAAARFDQTCSLDQNRNKQLQPNKQIPLLNKSTALS